jgi:hypothetical protein
MELYLLNVLYCIYYTELIVLYLIYCIYCTTLCCTYCTYFYSVHYTKVNIAQYSIFIFSSIYSIFTFSKAKQGAKFANFELNFEKP